ncbi:hypothetical protein IMCC14465_02770 [alpha proteobacterium IMCC14465]|uniref:Uncharacterized protein n=1 Tax=alpha proteobacterium IMCC14465 TaxID=1220535 RepID=J9DIF0_9PROT|nr:hypothetical protein IMCC14465_02770 [alpha proteobacterium IMCC14465]
MLNLLNGHIRLLSLKGLLGAFRIYLENPDIVGKLPQKED